MAIRNSSGTILTSLTVTPGSKTTLTATAAYQHLPLKADPECFTWSVSGDIGTVSVDDFLSSAKKDIADKVIW